MDRLLHIALFRASALFAVLLIPAAATANILQVGPGKPFATPCAAIAVAAPGDTIQIDTSGNYAGDVCAWTANNLHLVGVGSGRAVIDANGQNAQGKGIWVINSADGTIVENIEFKNATVPDGNGAGIRIDGGSLTVRNCYFHDNQNGILAGGSSGTMLVEFSEFNHNGAGDGFTHNIYVNNYAKFIFRYNYSHDSVVGHLVKSRAAETDILYNRLTDENGTGSYEIDLPNGGLSYVIGNLIEQGPNTQNSTVLSYQAEGPNPGNPDHELFVVNNTFVNNFSGGTFVFVDGSVSVPAVIKNNIFQGPGTLTNQGSAVLVTNLVGNALLVNPANFDYHLQSGSPAVDTGSDPGIGAGMSLTPVFQYVHPACAEGRVIAGSAIDIGAYELNGGTGVAPPSAPARCGTGSSAPAVTLAPTSLTFGNQLINTPSAPQDVTLTDSGNAALNINGISASGDFAQTNNCGGSLAAGGNCRISVTFRPTAAGSRTGSVTITDNANGSPHSVGLAGTGVTAAPAVTLSPGSLMFAGQVVGTASSPQTVTLTNIGNAPLSIAGITIVGANGGDFAQTNTCGTTLAASANCAISVTFKPLAGGIRNAALTIADNAAGSPQTVDISGTGQAFSLSVSPPSATVDAGQSASYTLTVTPASGFNQTVSLACSGAPPAASCSLTPSSVTLNGSSAATATVAVTTTARGLGGPRPMVLPPAPHTGVGLWILVAVMIFGLAAVRRRMKPAFGVAIILLLMSAGCVATVSRTMPPGSGGTPAGTSTLTITGTSGGVSLRTTFTLTVK